MNDRVVVLHKLTKKYGNTIALNNIDLTITRGDVVGLLGQNGSGKSTLIKLILNFVQPDEGIIKIFGKTNLEGTRSLITSVLDKTGFIDSFSAHQYLKLICNLKGIPHVNIKDVLRKVDLEKVSSKKIKDFSKGMRQRLGLSIALLSYSHDLYIFDEPTEGLDPEGIALFREIIEQLKSKNKTVIIASHIISELEKVCTNFIFLEKGNILKHKSAEHLIQEFGTIENAYFKISSTSAINK